eukprot:gene2651-2950_t
MPDAALGTASIDVAGQAGTQQQEAGCGVQLVSNSSMHQCCPDDLNTISALKMAMLCLANNLDVMIRALESGVGAHSSNRRDHCKFQPFLVGKAGMKDCYERCVVLIRVPEDEFYCIEVPENRKPIERPAPGEGVNVSSVVSGVSQEPPPPPLVPFAGLDRKPMAPSPAKPFQIPASPLKPSPLKERVDTATDAGVVAWQQLEGSNAAHVELQQ